MQPFLRYMVKLRLMQNMTDSQQAFINRQFFNLMLFALIFGVIFYDLIDALGFSYTDELCVVFVLLLYGHRVAASKAWLFNKAFLITLFIFGFYLVYSFIIQSNTKGAIMLDFIIQIKPYLSFFCVYALRPELSDSQKRMLRQLVVLCSLYVFMVGLTSFAYEDIIEYTFGHRSRIATASSILAIIYLYGSDYTRMDKYAFTLILAIGLMSTRSKHFGFFVVSVLLVFYINRPDKIKLNFRNVIFAVSALALTVLAAWEKIHYYFITGGFGSGRSADDLYARMALYYFATLILKDFFPFGSGFASYATHASGTSYSSIYAKYNMNHMHGLTKTSPAFVADTYYPALAQFGYAGIVLFFYFWFYLFRKAVRMYLKGFLKESALVVMMVVFFIIECTSDATLTHNRGMFMMMLLGLVSSEVKTKEENEQA